MKRTGFACDGQHASKKDTITAGTGFLTSWIKNVVVNMQNTFQYRIHVVLFLILVGVLAAGCVSDTPVTVTPTPAPAPTLPPAPAPIRTPVPPVETAPAPEPEPTPTPPLNTTNTLCDYPPCGRGGGGGGSGSSGGGTSPPPICELPTILLLLAGIGFVTICGRWQR